VMQGIEILMFNGFDELDVVAPFEIFVSTGFDVELVTLERSAKVVGAHGMAVIPSAELGSRPDLLVVPGGGWPPDRPRGHGQR
jgi:putative intracellular protease/amidase